MTTDQGRLSLEDQYELARKALTEKTGELVHAIRAEGKSRDFAEGYFIGVSLHLPDFIVQYARRVFAEIWPPETTDR